MYSALQLAEQVTMRRHDVLKQCELQYADYATVEEFDSLYDAALDNDTLYQEILADVEALVRDRVEKSHPGYPIEAIDMIVAQVMKSKRSVDYQLI